MENKKPRCPICKSCMQGYPAISRKDNKTKICSKCGIMEALKNFIDYQSKNQIRLIEKSECMKELDVYEEYRQCLLNSKVPILNLEIFETFIGSGFISNSCDLLELLIYNDTEQIIEELIEIKNNILEFSGDRYSSTEIYGYYMIAEGYRLRLHSRENNKKGVF